jgi:tetratricopeptide (TPR) repeat protein
MEIYEEAIQAYDKALEINPQNSWTWMHKGYTLYGMERYEEAGQAFDKAIELNPGNYDAWYSKGNTLRMTGYRRSDTSI